MAITDPNQEYFKNGQWIWDGSAWVKVGSIPGYLGCYMEREVDLTASAGINTFDFTVVPSGELWVVTSIVAANITKAADYIAVSLYDDPLYHIVISSRFYAVTQHVNWVGNLYIPEGWNIRVIFYDSDLNDDILCDVLGYKLSIFT